MASPSFYNGKGKFKASYSSSIKFVRKMSGRDPSTLSDRAQFLLKLNLDNIARVEKRYADQLMGDDNVPSLRDRDISPEPTRRQLTGRSRIRTPTPPRWSRNDRNERNERNERDERRERNERHERHERNDRTVRRSNGYAGSRPGASRVGASRPGTSRFGASRPVPSRTGASRRSTSPTRKRRHSPPARAERSTGYVPGKRPRIQPRRRSPQATFSANKELEATIYDHSEPEGKMLSKKWLKLESKILEAMVEEGNDDEIAFDGAGWNKGLKIIKCSNQKSLSFLKRTIANLCEEEGENLEVVTPEKRGMRPLISIWIPPPVPETKEAVLNLITRQNKELQTDDWKILDVKLSDKKGGKDFIITLSRSSLSKLQNNGSHIKFGLGALKVRVFSLLECENVEQSLRDRAKNGRRSLT